MNTALNVFQTHLVLNTHFLKTPVSNYTWISSTFCSSSTFKLSTSTLQDVISIPTYWCYKSFLQRIHHDKALHYSFVVVGITDHTSRENITYKCLQVFRFLQLEENTRQVRFVRNHCLVRLNGTLPDRSYVDWNKTFSLRLDVVANDNF